MAAIFKTAAVLTALASTAAFGLAANTSGPENGVRQDQCPTVANIDLKKIARMQGRTTASYRPDPQLEEVRVPPYATRQPPPDATFIVRVRLPGGGLYPQDERAVIWREADGTWWGWRNVLNDPNHPFSPPPPPIGSAEEKQQQQEAAAEAAAGYQIMYSSDSIYEGRLDAEQSAQLESAYGDPCRKLEPDVWPWTIPLLRPENGSRVRKCQIYQDSTFYRAEFTEGGVPRNIGLPCGSPGTLNGVLVTWSAHAGLPHQKYARRLTHEEIDTLLKH